MLTYSMEERGGLPLYEYLYRRIRQDILDGTLTAGERLPSKRALAEHLHLSVITVESAYQQLEAEGYVYTRPKRGFFVSAVDRVPVPTAPTPIPSAPAAAHWQLDLRSNQVDASRFPAAAWARLTRQVLAEGNSDFLSPVPHQGLPALRQAIANLPERERTVIQMRYFHGLTQDRVAKVMNVSQVQISRIEKKAIGQLRELMT